MVTRVAYAGRIKISTAMVQSAFSLIFILYLTTLALKWKKLLGIRAYIVLHFIKRNGGNTIGISRSDILTKLKWLVKPKKLSIVLQILEKKELVDINRFNGNSNANDDAFYLISGEGYMWLSEEFFLVLGWRVLVILGLIAGLLTLILTYIMYLRTDQD